MAKDNKIDAVTKDGTRIRMSQTAFEIAEKHFGVTRSFPAIKETPVELLKLPKKVEVIKAAPKEITEKAPDDANQALVPEVSEASARPAATEAPAHEVASAKRTRSKK